MDLRVGLGYDVHPLVEGRELWLGGVKIPYHKGCLGHSDADVLIHSLCDALLGSLALGDIGKHFPDTSIEYKNIKSTVLLDITYNMIKEQNYQLVNADITLCLEEPKISKHIPEMQQILSDILQTNIKNISIKATTNEKLGFIGRKEGIAAYSIVLVKKQI